MHRTQLPNAYQEIIRCGFITNLASTGKHPHSWPPARMGQSLSRASLKAFFQRSTEKFPWIFLEFEPLAAEGCMCGVTVCSSRKSLSKQQRKIWELNQYTKSSNCIKTVKSPATTRIQLFGKISSFNPFQCNRKGQWILPYISIFWHIISVYPMNRATDQCFLIYFIADTFLTKQFAGSKSDDCSQRYCVGQPES